MYDFTVIVLPGAYASSVALTLDMLAAAQIAAKRLDIAVPRWRVFLAGDDPGVGPQLFIKAKPLPAYRKADRSVWIVPGLGLNTYQAIVQRFSRPDARRLLTMLAAHARNGGTIAASCSAVFLLQAAGILIDRKITTSWWLAPQLQRLEPRCVVDANRMVIDDDTIVTGGAALAQTDLMLHLLRRRFGAALAEAISRALLIDARQSQAQYIVPALLANGNDLIARLTERIERILPKTPGIVALAKEFGCSERNLARRVRAATGQSTLALVQSVRMNKARALLESSRLSVEQIAERVGYSDATALRRLMRKTMGATPRQMRSQRASAAVPSKATNRRGR